MNPHLFLNKSVYFGVDNGSPILRYGEKGITHTLQLGEAIALMFLNETGCREIAINSCEAEIENGAHWVDHVIDRYWSYLGGSSGKSLDFKWLHDLDFETLISKEKNRTNVAPKSIVWLVTLSCNRRCIYCYYDVVPYSINQGLKPPDATYQKNAVFRMLSEMRAIGASKLYLTGGEPLLRGDIVDILREADRNRVRTYLSTKYSITRHLAKQLKEANVHSITYSLDAGNKKLANGLVRDQNFFDEAICSLRAMTEAGLNPEVNAVATRDSVNRLDELARLLVDCGIRQLSVCLFMEPLSHCTDSTRLNPTIDDTQIITLIDDLKARWSKKLKIRLGDSGQNLRAAEDIYQPVCNVGYTELHVLPDGRATRCRYLPNETCLDLGSLEQASIMDIWFSTALKTLNSPMRSTYEGTACASCGSFKLCNNRGRCFASAMKSNGTLIAPDSFCGMISNL